MAASPVDTPEPASPLPEGALCPECSYDLRGSTSARCPECGFALERLRTTESQIPWVHRRQLGWFRAYWKTVAAVMRSPKRFCQEMAHPVSYRDAQRFRWITALHGYVGLTATSAAWVTAAAPSGQIGEAQAWLLGGIQVWLVLMLAGLPGLASYFFQSSRLATEQQIRAIALSYYAWAPLALLPVAEVLLIGFGAAAWALAASPIAVWEIGAITLFASTLSTVIVAIAVDRSIATFLRHVLHGSAGARLYRMISLRALGLVLGLLALLLPLSLFYVVLIVYSLI